MRGQVTAHVENGIKNKIKSVLQRNNRPELHPTETVKELVTYQDVSLIYHLSNNIYHYLSKKNNFYTAL